MKKPEGKNSSNWSLSSRIKSFGYAFEGLGTAFRTEPNLSIHMIAAIGVSALGWWVKLDTTEWIILALTIGFVISIELINTALEYLADHVAPEKHPMVKACKDISSAAVLVASIVAVVVGCLLFIPKFL